MLSLLIPISQESLGLYSIKKKKTVKVEMEEVVDDEEIGVGGRGGCG